jgi:hypothetical protein
MVTITCAPIAIYPGRGFKPGRPQTTRKMYPAASTLGRPREAFVKPADLAGIKSAAGQFSTLELLC